MSLYRNCSNQKDYEDQSNMAINYFIEKRYKKKELLALKEKVKLMNRDMMIEGKKEKKKKKHFNMDTTSSTNP